MIQSGRLVVISGASQSGKTTHVKARIKKAARLIAWDPEDQWSQEPGFKKITRRSDLLKAIQQPGRIRIAYVAGGDLFKEFDFLCGCVMYAGRYIEGLVFIAEELSDVTNPAKAVGNWGILLRRGLKRGITIYAISQRWNEADKTAVGNASEFVFFRQSSADDAKYLAGKTRISVDEIFALIPVYYPNGRPKVLPYLILDAANGQIKHEKITF